MAGGWNKALVRIASAKDPTTLPGTDRVLFYDDRTITIYDGFAKAKYHFLVLPRIPFKAAAASSSTACTGKPTLSAANGKLNFGATSSNVVPASHMMSISTMLASPYAAEVLDALHLASDRAVEYVKNDMKEQYGVTWEVERAFHAVPSMEHLHLHVVSMDLVSDRLKHKKHYLSFHPAVGFAVRLNDIEQMVKEGKRALSKSEHAYEQLLKGPLTSHHTSDTFKFFPQLKEHLGSYWREKILAGAHGAKSVMVDGAAAQSAQSDPTQPPAPQRRKLNLHPRTVSVATAPAKNQDSSDEEDEPSLPTKRR